MKKENEIIPVQKPQRSAIVFETIFGNKAQIFIDNIEEMIWYPAGIVDIYTLRMHYFVKMDATEFDRLLQIKGLKCDNAL